VYVISEVTTVPSWVWKAFKKFQLCFFDSVCERNKCKKSHFKIKYYKSKISTLQIEHLKIYSSHLKIYIPHEDLHFTIINFKSNFWEQHFKLFGLLRSFVGLKSLVRKILKTHFYGWSFSHTLHIFIIHSSIFWI